MDVAAILPCRGRTEQTIRNVQRLLATAGDVDWHLYLIGSIGEMWFQFPEYAHVHTLSVANNPLSYWQALQHVTDMTDTLLIANLANDLLPGRHWLARGVAAYQARYGRLNGVMGFNDGLHGPEHSSHFLISRNLLAQYGGWPIWYRHNFGDTELCARARQDGRYGKAPWAVLYHDHLESGAPDDAVYQEGRAHYDQDAALFESRRRAGWPNIS